MGQGTSNTSAGPRGATRLALLLPVLFAVGCQGASLDADADAVANGSTSDSLAQLNGVNIPDPNGTYVAEVVANGSGCPAGTTNTRIAADGQVFTTTFSTYVTTVGPGTSINLKDCIISIKLHTPDGRSFSVQRFSYAGYALLNEGVTGTQTADYYFQGRPLPNPNSNRVQLQGPYDDSYLFTDDIGVDDRVWSPCGLERDLVINTRLALQSTNNRSGYMNMSALDGAIGKVEVVIASKRCSIGEETNKPVEPTSSVVKPANVRLSPSSVRRDQPFTVSWSAAGNSARTTYSVEVHEHYDFGYALLWRSAETTGTSLAYNGPPLPRTGAYHVVVVARDGERTATSDRALLSVTQSTTSPDNNNNNGGSLPAWARPLVGRYALRTDSFAGTATSSLINSKQLSIAEFVDTGDGGLELRVQACSSVMKLGTVALTPRNLESSPVLKRKVTLESGQRWSTDGLPIGIGFARDGASQCSGRRPGEYAPKRSDQPWILGSTCRCSVAGDVPRLDDCRINDPDRDGKPGFAFEYSGARSIEGKVSHAVSVDRTRYVNGQVSASGLHTAQTTFDGVTYQLQCENGQCDPDVPGRPCTPEYNLAQFVPAAGLTCADVRARESSLFRPVSVPRTCTQGETTAAP